MVDHPAVITAAPITLAVAAALAVLPAASLAQSDAVPAGHFLKDIAITASEASASCIALPEDDHAFTAKVTA